MRASAWRELERGALPTSVWRVPDWDNPLDGFCPLAGAAVRVAPPRPVCPVGVRSTDEALRAASLPREEEPAPREAPAPRDEPALWEEPVPLAVGVRPPVSTRAPEPRAGVLPPGCPAEAGEVVWVRTAVVAPRTILAERPEAVWVRTAVVAPRTILAERPEAVKAGRAIPVAPPRTAPAGRPEAVGVRTAVVAPRMIPRVDKDEEAEGAAPAARTTEARAAGVCTARAARAAW